MSSIEDVAGGKGTRVTEGTRGALLRLPIRLQGPVLSPSELRLTVLAGAQPTASADGVSPARFGKPLVHGPLAALGLASPGLPPFWEDPGDVMGEPLTRRKSSEAAPGAAFFTPAAGPGGTALSPTPLRGAVGKAELGSGASGRLRSAPTGTGIPALPAATRAPDENWQPEGRLDVGVPAGFPGAGSGMTVVAR